MAHFPKCKFFSESLLKSLVYFTHAYLHAKNLIGREQFLAITWEPDFSQAYNFPTMLMNYKNFHFTQIPDKTNDVIFLKVQKTMFLGIF